MWDLQILGQAETCLRITAPYSNPCRAADRSCCGCAHAAVTALGGVCRSKAASEIPLKTKRKPTLGPLYLTPVASAHLTSPLGGSARTNSAWTLHELIRLHKGRQ